MKTDEFRAFVPHMVPKDEQYSLPESAPSHSNAAFVLLVVVLIGGVGFFWKEISAARSELITEDDFLIEQQSDFAVSRNPIFNLAISPFGDALIYRNHHGNVQKQQLVYDDRDIDSARGIFADSRCEQMIFSPVENQLALALSDGEIMLKNLDQPDSEATILASSGQVVECLAFSPEGRLLAGGLSNGTVIVWDVHKKTTATLFRRKGQSPSSIIFDTEMSLLVSYSSSLERWELNVNHPKHPEKMPLRYRRKMDWSIDQPSAREMIVSNDGKLLITSHFNNRIRGWDLETQGMNWETQGVLPCARSLRFSPDESFFVCQSEPHALHFRDPETGDTIASLVDHSMGTGTGARFSFDGKLLYSASSDGLIRVWTVPGQSLIGTVETENFGL